MNLIERVAMPKTIRADRSEHCGLRSPQL